MDRHAYLIITHTDKYNLEKLISLVDDKRNDIFILKDKKAPKNLLGNLSVKNSNLYVLTDEININWGGQSQMKAELKLLKAAIDKNKYEYLHLLSGVDLPIKSQDFIHNLFSSIPKNSNILSFSPGEDNFKDLKRKTNYYYIFNEYHKNKNKFIKFSTKFIRSIFLKFQKAINFKRNYDIELKKGSNWITLSCPFAEYLVKKENELINKYKFIPCVDEIFIHSEVWNSKFKNTILDLDQHSEFKRKIDWKRGRPYIWREEDFEELQSCPQMFARKFSSTLDKSIIDKISDHIISSLG